MDTILFIILIALQGLLVGALGRLLLPGPDPMSIFQTMLLGIAGSLIAGVIVYYAFDESEGPGFLAALAVTVLLVFIIRKIRERQAAPAGPPPSTRA